MEDKETEEEGMLSIKNLLPIFLQHWKWFLLSFIVCMGCAVLYLHYTPRVYVAMTKILVKDDESGMHRSTKSALQNVENLGIMTNSAGIDNEVEILSSPATMEDVVRKLDLNIDYAIVGRVTNRTIYKNQPVTAILDMKVNDEDFYPINIKLSQNANGYVAKVNYYLLHLSTQKVEPIDTVFEFKKLPYIIDTKEGNVTLVKNPLPHFKLGNQTQMITINSYVDAAVACSNRTTVDPSSKMTTIADVSFTDVHPRRATEFLTQLVKSYNDLANDDKNEVAKRTEEFINGRLEKIDAELGATESQLESYKRSNNVFELRQKAQVAITQQSQYEQKLTDAATQIELLTGLREFMNNQQNMYETMPFNIGIQDQSTTTLISKYNEAVLQRKRYLVTSSEASPTVVALTSEVDGLEVSLRQAVDHALRNAQTVYRIENEKLNKYASQLSLTPSQERVLTQIGRQQEVRSDIYLMLLQKREENSISLAATADKGKPIFKPLLGGVVSPKRNVVLAIALAISLVLPFAVFLLLQLLRYKIEDREDVKKLTKAPILAELASVNDTAKTKGEVVVHENSNNHSEEMFRLLRTNLLFTMKEGEKVILFTSSIPGEGKTFAASNLAISFALYGKRVLLVGLDIRKPRLADLFEINDHHHGISLLLQKTAPTKEDVNAQIVPSGVNDNLNLLMAGPIPPNPSELVGRQSLEIVINLMKEEYDYIILDTAPVTLVTDTLQIGRVANASVFVCRANHTPKNCFQYFNEIVEEQKLPNVSLVINGIDYSNRKYRLYGRYGRYGQYGSYGSYGSYGYGNVENDPTIKRKKS